MDDGYARHAQARRLYSRGRTVSPNEFLMDHVGDRQFDRMEESFRRAASQMPRVLAERSVREVNLGVPELGASLPNDVRIERLALLTLPYGSTVILVSMAFDAPLSTLIDLLRHTLFRWHKVRYDGTSLEQVSKLFDLGTPLTEGIVVGIDVHHVLILDTDQVVVWRAPSEEVSASSQSDISVSVEPKAVNLNIVEGLVYRTHERIRSKYGEIRFPAAINRYEELLVAVGAAVTVLAPGRPELNGWIVWSQVQLTASLSRLRQIRAHAYAVLEEIESRGGERLGSRAARGDTRQRLARVSAALAELEVDLAFGVDAYVDVQLVLSSPMLAYYHRDAAAAMGLPRGVEITENLLKRATITVDARRQVLNAAERAADEVRIQRASAAAAVLGVVAVISGIFFGFFGSAASPVQKGQPSFFSPAYLWFYVLLVGLVVLIALLFWIVRKLYQVRGVDADLLAWGLEEELGG